jgi:hypothetical protein
MPAVSPAPTTYRRRVPVLPGRVDAERLTEIALAARSLTRRYLAGLKSCVDRV